MSQEGKPTVALTLVEVSAERRRNWQKILPTVALMGSCALLLARYVGLLKPSGRVLHGWLAYLTPDQVPLDRLLIGALWLACLVELCGGADLFFAARRRFVRPACAALAAGCALYVMRDQRIMLGDGPALLHDPVGAVTSAGYYTFVEELAGMWLPLRLARIRFAAGVPPVAAIVDGYRIVSIGCGMLFVAALADIAPRKEAPRAFALMMLGHAGLLMFTGYVENYVGAFTLIAVTLLLVSDALERGPVAPQLTLLSTALCALAILFHGVAVWSLVALVYLAVHTRHSGALGLLKVALANTLLGLATLIIGYSVFRYWLTPGVETVHVTPLMEGGSTLPFATSLAELGEVRPLHEHLFATLRVGAPGLIALVALCLTRPRHALELLRARDVHFALALWLGFFLHQLLWRSTLGTYQDWDLFGFAALPIAYLGARSAALLVSSRVASAALFALCVIAGLSWPLSQMGPPVSEQLHPWSRALALRGPTKRRSGTRLARQASLFQSTVPRMPKRLASSRRW